MVVKLIKCHVGIHLFGAALTVEAEKFNCDMRLHPAGVLVRYKKKSILVPFTNITHVELEGEVDEAAALK